MKKILVCVMLLVCLTSGQVFGDTPDLSTFNGSCESFFVTPTPPKSFINNVWEYLQTLGPLSGTLGNTAKRENLVVSTISALLLGGSPSTVFFKVSLRIINSIKGHSRGALSHVLIEDTKIFPFSTDTYSSSPIVFKRFIVGVLASLEDSSPSVICGKAPKTMCSCSRDHEVYLIAAAAFGVPRFNVCSYDINNFSTRTPTLPHRLAPTTAILFNDQKPVKSFSCKIKGRHSFYLRDLSNSIVAQGVKNV